MEYTKLLDRPIAFHRIFVDIAGGLDGGILLSQLVYWHRRLSPGREWFWKSDDEWFAELGIKRTALASARLRLEGIGVLKTELRGYPYRRFYRLNLAALDAAIGALLGAQNGTQKGARNTPELALETGPKELAQGVILPPVCRNQLSGGLQESTNPGIDSSENKNGEQNQTPNKDCRNQQTNSLQESTLSLQESTLSLQKPTNCFIDYNRDYNTQQQQAREPGCMTLDWQPAMTTLDEHCQHMGLRLSNSTAPAVAAAIGEFKSYWASRPDRIYPPTTWIHRLATALVRLSRTNGGVIHDPITQATTSRHAGSPPSRSSGRALDHDDTSWLDDSAVTRLNRAGR